MSDNKLKVQMQNSVENYIFSLVNQYSIPLDMMEDALYRVLYKIKEAQYASLVAQEKEHEDDDRSNDNNEATD